MDDFDDFTSSSNAGGEIDFDAAAAQFPDISLDGDFTVAPVPTRNLTLGSSSSNDFLAFDPQPPAQTALKVTGDDEIEKFSSEFPDIEVPTSPPFIQQQAPTFGAPRPQPSAFTSTPILTQEIEEDEPQVIKEWREKQAEEIAKREAAAKDRRQATITKAEQAIDEYYEAYNQKKARAIRDNKDSESHFIETLSGALSKGTTWQRICEYVELENSQSKTIARSGTGTTDLTRFKEVLLRLKREGDNAPGAAGF
ncbi:Clathrin light chain [Mycena indigotica]|uniref:Clathrin light chain n=1 Tax=Mycena indigotica TaxID=2126181 RepID=A0A8H6VPI3_9AGAR|nr:Clathrin light chain [Mycena indigotica]KAF7289337.1 Clathrin light chain [Mycena indigotica]